MLKRDHGKPDREFFWEHEGNRAVQQGKWKLVPLGNGEGGWELYNLQAIASSLTTCPVKCQTW